MICVIADDLTGAAELGSIGLRCGLAAELFVRPRRLNPEVPTGLVCVDTDSRSSGSSEAAARASQACGVVSSTQPAWIYKKVDSVLRGNVVAEIAAIMQELGFRRALLAPANPSFGRIIRDGRYYVNGKPISETDFAHDPDYPRRSSDVHSLLGDATSDSVKVLKPGQDFPETGIALAEVSSLADVIHWAQRSALDMLCAGGVEFFSALLQSRLGLREGRVTKQPARDAMPAPAPGPRELFVCGSISEATQRFVAESKAAGIPVFRPPSQPGKTHTPTIAKKFAKEIEAALKLHARVILSTSLPVVKDQRKARRIAIDLVRIAKRVFEDGLVEHFCVEGGATAAAFAREVGWAAFEVVNELAPGVTTLKPKASSVWMTVKPGSYPGWHRAVTVELNG